MRDVKSEPHHTPANTPHETPIDSQLPPSPNLSTVITRIRKSLVIQPRPDAQETSRAALLPLLYAGGVDIFDLQVLRTDGRYDRHRIGYQLNVAGAKVPLEVWGVGVHLPEPQPRNDVPWELICNGPDWALIDHRQDPPGADRISLYDPIFPTVLLTLLSARSPLALGARLTEAQALLRTHRYATTIAKLITRLGAEEVRDRIDPDGEGLEALLREQQLLEPREPFVLDEPVREALRQELNATQFGFIRPAGPLADITFEDVVRHARLVINLRGRLRAQLDGQEVPIYSRSALYFVLASLALQHGREDALPTEDLVLPPELPPENRRARPLGRAGWYLLLDHNDLELHDRSLSLLETLRLQDRFEATQGDQPYPTRPPQQHR